MGLRSKFCFYVRSLSVANQWEQVLCSRQQLRTCPGQPPRAFRARPWTMSGTPRHSCPAQCALWVSPPMRSQVRSMLSAPPFPPL